MAIDVCWKEQERKSLEPSLARFIAGACEKMQADLDAGRVSAPLSEPVYSAPFVPSVTEAEINAAREDGKRKAKEADKPRVGQKPKLYPEK